MYNTWERRPSMLSKVINRVFGFIVAALVVILGLVFNPTIIAILILSWPISLLWNWCFIITFPGVPHIGYWMMLGILVMMRLIKGIIT